MIPNRPRRPVAAVAVAAAWLLISLILPAVALGHAELATMTPADKASVPPPTEIVGTFTENLDISASSFTVVNGGGSVLAKGGAVDAGDPKTMRLALTGAPLAPGGYTIRWTSKSALDGDIARGTTSFTVVAASPSPSPAPSASVGGSGVPSASAEASLPASAAASPSPSGGSGASSSSTDAVIPVVIVLAVLAVVAYRLLRGRSRPAA